MSAGVGPGGTVTVEGPAVTFGAGTGEARAAPAPARDGPAIPRDPDGRCRAVCVAAPCAVRFGNTRCVAPHRADDPVLATDPPGSPEEHYHGGWEEVGNAKCRWRALPGWGKD